MKAIIHKTFILYLFISVIYSCGETGTHKKKKVEKITISLPAPYKKPGSSFNDTLVVKSVSAIFFNPDSVQLDKMKTTMEKNIYETDVHNCFYQMRNARRVIKQFFPDVHIIETSTARYLVFVKEDKSRILFDLNTNNDMCGLFLFNKKKDPELVDMMNIDTFLEYYFKK